MSNFMAPSASVQMPSGVAGGNFSYGFDNQSQYPTGFGNLPQQVRTKKNARV